MIGDRPFSDISYRQFLQEERLMGSRCKECGALFVPPRSICIHCFSADMEWVEMAGKGQLAAFTCISIGPPAMIAEGYNRKNPYCSGVIKLDEGAKVDARIEGVDTLKPETIKVGMPMKVQFRHRDGAEGAKTYLAFEPA